MQSRLVEINVFICRQCKRVYGWGQELTNRCCIEQYKTDLESRNQKTVKAVEVKSADDCEDGR